MFRLKLASCLADNSETLCLEIARYIEDRLGVPTDYITGIPWQERERLFDLGDIQILWLCGLPYVQKADQSANTLELLAVPVPAGARYRARPVYFADVVVRRHSPYQTLFVRAYLAGFGERQGFFGETFDVRQGRWRGHR